MRHALERVDFGDRIGHHLFGRQAGIDDAIDERGVGAILEQAPHQVRQQVFVRAHRRVHAAGVLAPGPAHHAVVQLRAHAVQALEFEAIRVAAEHFGDVRDGVRVVRRELRIDALAGALEQARAGEVRHVGVRLAREHRIAGEPALLRALDLAVPVGALDQAQRDAPVGFAQPLHQPLERGMRALLVGLHREAEARVAARDVARQQPVDQQQRQLEPFGLLGVERHADAGVARPCAPAAR